MARSARRRSGHRYGVWDLEWSTTREASSACGNFFIWIRHNPLKSPDSTKEIEGIFLGFPCISLHETRPIIVSVTLRARSARGSHLDLPYPPARSTTPWEQDDGIRRESLGWNQAAPAKKTPELSLRGCQFQLIGRRSEVTGDAETARETSADALPTTRHEGLVLRAKIFDGSKKPGWRRLDRALIHQLEVEVEVGDRVPAEIRADEPAERARRYRAQRSLTNLAARRQGIAAAAHAAPPDAADRPFEIGVELLVEVMLEQRRDRPGGGHRPRVGQWI